MKKLKDQELLFLDNIRMVQDQVELLESPMLSFATFHQLTEESHYLDLQKWCLEGLIQWLVIKGSIMNFVLQVFNTRMIKQNIFKTSWLSCIMAEMLMATHIIIYVIFQCVLNNIVTIFWYHIVLTRDEFNGEKQCECGCVMLVLWWLLSVFKFFVVLKTLWFLIFSLDP